MGSRLDLVVKVTQAVLYLLTGALGLAVAVPVGITKDDFMGSCVLYSSGYWTTEEGIHVFNMSAGNSSNCNFIITCAVVLFVVYGLIQGVVHLVKLVKELHGGSLEFMECLNSLFLAINVVAVLCSLIMACILTVGLQNFCSALLDNDISFVNKCTDIQDRMEGKYGENWSRFYTCLKVAQVSAWLSFVVEILRLAVTLYIVVHQGWLAELCPCFARKTNTDKEILSPAEIPPENTEVQEGQATAPPSRF